MDSKNTTKPTRKGIEKEVIQIYRKVLSECQDTPTFAEICCRIAASPASRFYLNSRRAYEYCCARDRGETPIVKRSYHRALLEAFYDVLAIELLNASRYDNMKRVIARALNRPAPSLGITPRIVQRILQSTLHIHTSRNAKK